MKINPISIPMQLPLTKGVEQVKETQDSFGKMLANAINQVNDQQLKAEEITKQFLIGEVQDIHQVTIAAEEARLTLDLAVQVRNKVVEAYQEISRMSI